MLVTARGPATAFQGQHTSIHMPVSRSRKTSSKLSSTYDMGYQQQGYDYYGDSSSYGSSSSSSSSRQQPQAPPRDVESFQNWAMQCGVTPENGFTLVPDMVDGNEDWFAATASGGTAGSRVLYCPSDVILSASRAEQEFGDYAGYSLQKLQQEGMSHLSQEFYLFLKILAEYEKGYDSFYYSWIEACPKVWTTAASMDDFCLKCLPPFLKKLCIAEQKQLDVFRDALRSFDYISFETKGDKALAQFAYNVVNTRAFPTDSGDLQMVPLADMLNHGYPANCELQFDDYGDCHVLLTQDVQPGSPLLLSYGELSNPSRLMSKYGFLDDYSPAQYCKILISNPSVEIENIGYDPSRMVFYTEDGGISEEVWDVMLYSRLKRKPQEEYQEDARRFYEAHMTGDANTKSAIHAKYMSDTVGALKRHVGNVLSEVSELKVKTNVFDASKHPRLPLIRRHNDMVISTFQKVLANLEQIQ